MCQKIDTQIEIMNASHQLFKSLYFPIDFAPHGASSGKSVNVLNVQVNQNKNRESSGHTQQCHIGGAFLKTIAISNFYSLILPPYEEL